MGKHKRDNSRKGKGEGGILGKPSEDDTEVELEEEGDDREGIGAASLLDRAFAKSSTNPFSSLVPFNPTSPANCAPINKT